MTDLDKLEDLLRKGEKEKAYELVKEDKGITTKILMNEGIFFGTLEEYSISISYFELVERISENNRIKEDVREILVMAYYGQGIAHFGLKQYKEAIEDYSKAIELNPKFAEAYYNRGLIYHELNQQEKAIEDYNRAIEGNPEYAYAYNNRGNAYLELKQYEKAIEDCNRAIGLNPKYTEAYFNRGNAYFGLKQYKEAINDCNRVIELNPTLAVAYYNRGGSYLELKQHEKAIEDCNKAIELNPTLAEAYHMRGFAYQELKRHEEAIKDCNRAIELNPTLAVAYYSRGGSYLELKQHEKAIEDCNKAIELNPTLAEAYYNRGVSHLKLNKHEKAIDDCNRVIELNPTVNLAKTYNNRGVAYSNSEQHEKAIEDYNKAIELNPTLAVAYQNRGFTLLSVNADLDKAIGDFKCARCLLEGRDKEGMLGYVEWAMARKEMNMKNWRNFRERMNAAREIFEKINDPLSLSFAASVKFSYLDEKLDNALNILEPIRALEEIEKALKEIPKDEGSTEPERRIFSARFSSFEILSRFISSMRRIGENSNLEEIKDVLTKLHTESKEVEEMFESVNFDIGKTSIVDLQRIISSVKQDIEELKWAANKKEQALTLLEKYWSRLSSAIKAMNGISTTEIENITLRKEIKVMKSELLVGFAEINGAIRIGFEKSSEEHKEILEIIYETKNILLQKDAVNARYRIEIQAPLISSLSPISPKIIVDIPMGNVTEAQIEEKAEEIADKIKDLSGKVKKEFLEAIKRVPEKGKKLWKRLKKTKG